MGPMAGLQIKEGEYTATVYRLIRDGRYGDAVQILSNEVQKHSRSRAGLSLLGYCYFQMQKFINAADCYEQLTHIHPEVEEYKLYHAQCLYKACMYKEAMKSTFLLDSPAYRSKMLKLQAAIKYGEEDLSGAKSLVEQLPADDPDSDINMGCILYKEGQYEEACRKFISGMKVVGYRLDLSYNIAVCYYSLKHYSPALINIADIIECGIKEHPEYTMRLRHNLICGSPTCYTFKLENKELNECGATDGIDLQSVGNTLVLHETGLIEAFNLKAAIQYKLNNYEAAQEALTDMPPRSEEELDPVTLHNQALMNMDSKPTEGFEKLQFLLQQNPFPPETFANLLILYCKYEYFNLAADVLAENAHLAHKFLSPYLYNFLDALITCQTAPEEAFIKFDEQARILSEHLGKLSKQVEESRNNRDDDTCKKAVEEHDEALEKYIPVLMAQAKIYWNMENYQMVEKIFQKSVIYCQEHDVWKVNVAHALFMQHTKETIVFYEAIVKKYYDNILNVSAIVLANLCVSYILANQQEAAEELLRKIRNEEEMLAYDKPHKKSYHLCIVNLVIGTHFCAKGDYGHGIPLVLKSLEPYNKKLGTDTWYYVKRCVLSLLESMSKHTVMLQDSLLNECIQFLELCEYYGKNIPAVIEQPLEEERMHSGKNTVTYEARQLKALFYEVTAWNV